jgi:hypothetical protein
VSNYRVRQVLAIKPKLLESKLRLMVALATWMNDDSMTAEVSFDLAMEQAQIARNTARDARKALAADGYLSWTSPHGRGNRTAWTFHKLPELKGPSDVDLFSEADVKGVSDADPLPALEKGSTGFGKRGQPERADLQGHGDKLNRQANDDDARAATARLFAAQYGWTDEHAERVVETIIARARKPVTHPAQYVDTAIQRDGPESWAPQAARWCPKNSNGKPTAAKQKTATPSRSDVDDVLRGPRCPHKAIVGRCALCRHGVPPEPDELGAS